MVRGIFGTADAGAVACTEENGPNVLYEQGGWAGNDEEGYSNLGAYLGYGPSAFYSNADTYNELRGPFNTIKTDVAIGPISGGVQISHGDNGIWSISVSPPVPLLSGGLGIHVSDVTTTTYIP